jgi:plastocyanin
MMRSVVAAAVLGAVVGSGLAGGVLVARAASPATAISIDNFTRSQALDTDDSFSFTFTTPGTYQYFCYVHPHMTGTIVVEAATGSNASN